jgi:hypothetical protein
MEKENLSVSSETNVSEPSHLNSNTLYFAIGQNYKYYSARKANTRPLRQKRKKSLPPLIRRLEFTTYDDIEFSEKPLTLLLPCKYPILEIDLARTPMSFKSRCELLTKYVILEKKWNTETVEQALFRHSLPFKLRRWCSELKKEIYTYILQEKKIKYAFKQLLNKWLYKKYAKTLFNTEDPFTLMEPEKPILLFMPNQRGSYVFELSSIKKSIHTSLTEHEYLFPRPSMPRNPLTNIPFTIAQLTELIRCIRCYGKSSWAIEGFSAMHYNLPRYKLEFHNTIQHNGFKEYLSSDSDDAKEHFADFIEWVYDWLDLLLDLHVVVSIVKWTAQRYPNDNFIKKWKTLYKNYYQINITYPALSMTDGKYDKVRRDMVVLVNSQNEIARITALRLQNLDDLF